MQALRARNPSRSASYDRITVLRTSSLGRLTIEAAVRRRLTVTLSDLLGPTSYVKALNSVANETYPTSFTQGVTVTINSVAGVRTITYSP